MQIHELNNFTGTVDNAFIALDDGNDTGRKTIGEIIDPLNTRIDNIVAGGDAPSPAEITDARMGANGIIYPSLGDAIRGQISQIEDDIADVEALSFDVFNGYFLLNDNKLIYAQNNVRIVYAEVPSGVNSVLVKKQSGGVFQVGFTATAPANGVPVINEAGSYENAGSGIAVSVEVPDTAVYIVAYVWNSVLDTAITADDMIDTVSITVIRGAKDVEAREGIAQLNLDLGNKANSDGSNTDYITITKNGYTLDSVNLHSGALDNQGNITPNPSFTVTDSLYLDAGIQYTIQYQGYYDGITEKNAPRMVCTYEGDGTFSRAFAEISSITLYSDEKYIIINGFTHETMLNVFPSSEGSIKNIITAPTMRIDYHNVYNAPGESETVLKMERKATFSFVFDDATDGDVNVKALFDSYGYRCGFALPLSALTQAKITRYLEYQAYGYEILSHSTDGTGMADPSVDISVIEGKMKTSKQTLESYGFTVNGFVTPSSAILATYIPALKRWYRFGLGQISDQSGYQVNTFSGEIEGIATDRDVSQLPRCSLEATASTVAFLKGIINKAVQYSGYVCFYGHNYPSTTNNMTEANVKEILDYLVSLENQGKAQILPPSEAISDFYSVRHSDYLALL